MKSKLLQWLQPLIPVLGLSMMFLRPDYSIGRALADKFMLTSSDIRTIDTIAFSAMCTYTFALFDSIKIKPLEIKISFEDIPSRNNLFCVLNPPGGKIKKVKLVVEIKCRTIPLSSYFVRLLFKSLLLRVNWPINWVECRLLNNDSTFRIEDDYILLPLNKLANVTGGKGSIIINIATRHSYTEAVTCSPKTGPQEMLVTA